MVWTTVACVRPSIALTHACTCGYLTAEAVILIPPLSIIGVFAGSVYDCLALLSPLNVSTPQGDAPLHAGGMGRGQHVPAQIHEVAIGAAAQVVMLIRIDIFRHEVAVPIE